MPYQANRPLANDQLSQSQQDINGNFQILGSIGGNIQPNSAGINTAPGAGFNYLYLQTVANPPLGTAFAANTALYSAVFNTKANLFVNKVNNAGNQQYPITSSILDTATPGNGTSGWSYLPSGLIIKWGVVGVPNIAAGGTANFDATVGFSAVFSATLGQQAVVSVNPYVSYISALTVNSITVVNRVSNMPTAAGLYVAANIYYFVIGR
jgi:hypothetical protein